MIISALSCCIPLINARGCISIMPDSNNNFVGNDSAKEAKLQLLNFFDENQVCVKLPPKKDFGEMSCDEIRCWKAKHLDGIET